MAVGRMGHLVFVSTELFPFTPGDIGQTMSGMLRAMDASDLARTTVVLVDAAVDVHAFQASYPGADLLNVSTSVDTNRFAHGRQHPPQRAYTHGKWHWRSAVVFRALAALAQRISIDYIEFPDRGALGFCALQERRLTGFQANATLAVRLHSSHTVLLHAEAQPVALEDLNHSDLERKCLRDCDRVVFAIHGVAEATREIFGFAAEEWTPRLLQHAVPLHLNDSGQGVHAAPASPLQPIAVFTRLRRFERPDVFVRGAARFFRARPTHAAPALLVTDDVGASEMARVRRLVPADLAPRFEFVSGMPESERKGRASRSTVVFPALLDAFGAAAYEASLLGARVILNGTNPAFGDATPWQDGVNCLKFDGTVGGLALALERNLDRNETLRAVEVPVAPWPWLSTRSVREPWRTHHGVALVSVVVPHYNLGAFLPATIESLIAQTYSNIEILVVDDASTDPDSIRAIDELAHAAEPRVRVLRQQGNAGLAATRNVGVRSACGKYVLTLDADDLIHPRFVALAVEALENNPDFDVVVTPAGYFLDGEAAPPSEGHVDFFNYSVFSGEAVLAGLIENRFSTATALFRKTALDRFPYDESLGCYEDWSLFMRMCEAGHRFIAATDVFFFYRKRIDSMVHAPREAAGKRIEYNDLIRTSAPAAIRQKSRQLVMGLGSAVASDGAALPRDLFGRSGRYDDSVVFAALKVSRWIERRAPWLLRGGLFFTGGLWRAYRALGNRR